MAKSIRDRVRFGCSSLIQQIEIPTTGLPDLVNLCMNKNFCAKLSERWQRPSSLDECVGYLSSLSGHKQLVYITKECRQSQARHAISLERLLTSVMKTSPVRYMLHLERLRFARILATAVLQFHSTPWLKDGWWRSENVCIRGRSDAIELLDPFVELPIRAADEKTASSTQDILPFCNPLLFGLALLLIELVYRKPLSKMIIPCLDGASGRRSKVESEFYAAKRLIAAVDAKIFPAYKRVVERCLFWVDADLSTQASQEGFYSDLVCCLCAKEARKAGGRFRLDAVISWHPRPSASTDLGNTPNCRRVQLRHGCRAA